MSLKKAAIFCLCFAVVFSLSFVFVSGTTYDFGGMYSPGFSNPLTGTWNCPTGYSDGYAYASGPDGYIYSNHHFCYREHVDGYDGYEFGGAYNRDDYGNNKNNPVTGGRWCPSGYATGNLDYINYCYRSPTGSGAEYSLGGFYTGGSPPITNPITGAASCPPDYTVSTVLDGYYEELEMSDYDTVPTLFFATWQLVPMNMCLMEVEDEIDCSGLTPVSPFPDDSVCPNVDSGDFPGCSASCGAESFTPGEAYACGSPTGYCEGVTKCIPGTCVSPANEQTCDDSIDNDTDGDTDCADSDCVGETGPDGYACCANDADCYSVEPGRCMAWTCDTGSTNECEENVDVGTTCIPTAAETGEASDEDVACSIFTCIDTSGSGTCSHTGSESEGEEIAPCSGEYPDDICNKMTCDGYGACISTPYPDGSEDDSRCVGEYPAEVCYKKACDDDGDCVKTHYGAKSTEDSRCTSGNFTPGDNDCKFNACSEEISDGDSVCQPFRKIAPDYTWPTSPSGEDYKIVSRGSGQGCAAGEGSNPLASSTHGQAFWGDPQALGLGGATSTSCCAYPICPGEDYSKTTFVGGKRGTIKYSCVLTSEYAGIKAEGGSWALTSHATERCENNSVSDSMCAYNTTFATRYPKRVPDVEDVRIPNGGGGGGGGNYCQGQACVFNLNPGPGAKQCINDVQCELGKHAECNGANQCIMVNDVTGFELNECLDDVDCINLDGMHTECNGPVCENVVDVIGDEDNECAVDADCGLGPNQLPVADATVGEVKVPGEEYYPTTISIVSGTTVTLHSDQDSDDLDEVSSFDPEETQLAYEWSCKSGPCAGLLGLEAQNPTATITTGLAGNSYVFELVVTDQAGLGEASAAASVTVNVISGGLTHNACVGTTCQSVPGAGTDFCFNSTECETQHQECDAFNTCITVAGAGTNTCVDDSACAAGVEPDNFQVISFVIDPTAVTVPGSGDPPEVVTATISVKNSGNAPATVAVLLDIPDAAFNAGDSIEIDQDDIYDFTIQIPVDNSWDPGNYAVRASVTPGDDSKTVFLSVLRGATSTVPETGLLFVSLVAFVVLAVILIPAKKQV